MGAPEITETTDFLEEAVRRAQSLFEINLRLNRMRDLDALLGFIIETAADVLDCSAASILLYKEESTSLEFSAATGSDPEQLAEIPVPLDDSIAGRIFTENEPVVVNNVAQDESHFDSVGEEVGFSPKSLVGVPLRIGDEPIGVLECLNKREGPFTQSDVSVLSVIAAQAAIAIRNARQVEALERANTQLSRLDELKSDFMALASHELRTPLSSILGFANTLENEVDAELQSHVESILDAAGRMQTVVETMTQMVMLRSGEAQLDKQSVTLQELIRAVHSEVTADRSRYPSIVLDLPDEPVQAHLDSKRTQRIIANLLDNALQFTSPEGEVVVELEAFDEAVQVAVHDTGIGIAEEELDRVFDGFYQVEDTLTRTQEGLGLGLTIARKLVRLHDGTIWLESEGRGEGTSAYVRLPYEDD
ncbi:MAG: ATP-binding protein [Salinibacter sp.]